ncbi:MAG: DNA methyltransferase, partial [Candidatus Marinimicrobia bacterium]|nr:DNA methyltransferase [Candidatus Neomarinimicrobiota bacterium]
DLNENTLLNRIRAFKHSDFDDDNLHNGFQIRVKKGWSIRKAYDELNKLRDGELKSFIKLTLYRPFDVRPIFYHDSIVWRTVKQVMRHMLAGENLALITHKREELDIPWGHALITNMITEHGVTSSKTTNYHFPLYLYPEEKEKKPKSGVTLMVFEPEAPYGKKGKQPNIAPEIFEMLKTNFGRTPTPEKILYYIYGVLYSNHYRTKYIEFLKFDFPRVPFTKDKDVFNAMAKLGQKLSDLHLMKSPTLNRPVSKYEGSGTNDNIEKPIYNEDEQRVYINSDKYFSKVKPDVWNYHIGGYQVLAKYLKDRKGRQMDDPRHYCRIVTALEKTIEIQKKIDELYINVEKNLI